MVQHPHCKPGLPLKNPLKLKCPWTIPRYYNKDGKHFPDAYRVITTQIWPPNHNYNLRINCLAQDSIDTKSDLNLITFLQIISFSEIFKLLGLLSDVFRGGHVPAKKFEVEMKTIQYVSLVAFWGLARSWNSQPLESISTMERGLWRVVVCCNSRLTCGVLKNHRHCILLWLRVLV